ncbi:membrane protein (plasmid) [Fibrisoma limi BUZ 3]|uniref:Membrane protein n=1 Tax=Fibrisoma limi BUZ 3 TaxID=1185876 RepID=I2GU68_9BACT|nr:membrane protein [Fibrisoma limi]CCH57669.1 membrane protein [Fibrisoma limi BUZ 3]
MRKTLNGLLASLVLGVGLLGGPVAIMAQGNDNPNGKQPDSSVHQPPHTGHHPMGTHQATQIESPASMPPPIDAIPTAHSAVVHFPLVLLLVAAVFQLIALFRPRKGLHWQVAGLALGGFVGAYAASSLAHPHTHGLSQSALHVLEHHEQLARYTVWLAGTALLLKMVTLWRPYRWLEALTALVLVGSVYFVMHASHMGGELLYRYGVGPRGAYLERHEEGHADGNRHEHKHPEKAD